MLETDAVTGVTVGGEGCHAADNVPNAEEPVDSPPT